MGSKAKGTNLIHSLLLVLKANPKVAGHYRPVRTDDHFPQFEFVLPGFEHGRVYETNIRDAPEFFIIVIHRFLYFYT